MTMREIITDWNTPGGGPGVSVMYFATGGGTVDDQVSAVGSLWGDLEPNLSDTTTYTVRADARVIDETTGNLTGVDVAAAAQVGSGVGGEPVPDAAQLLLQWITSGIANNRVIRGRTFVPGIGVGAISEGNVLAAVVTGVGVFLDDFLALDVGFSIWHRPVGVSAGSAHAVDAASVWSEFAVLRQRRS